LDDGGQLCAKVLAVEPLLKQYVHCVPHIVSAKAEVKITKIPICSGLEDLSLGTGPAELSCLFPLCLHSPVANVCMHTCTWSFQKHAGASFTRKKILRLREAGQLGRNYTTWQKQAGLSLGSV
jgi:hypothetical protein